MANIRAPFEQKMFPSVGTMVIAWWDYFVSVAKTINDNLDQEVKTTSSPTFKQIKITSGAVTDYLGESTLVAGTKTILNTNINTNSLVFLTRSVIGGTLGHLNYTKIDGVSFTINSSSVADTSKINWIIINKG